MANPSPALEQITRWGKVPGWWLEHPKVDLDRYAVMCALTTYADEDGYCMPSQATLARLLCRSRPLVNRIVADLAALGLLRKQSRSRTNGGTTSCRYQLAQTPEQAIAFAAENEGAVPSVTAACPRHDGDCHRGDTSHLELEHNQNPRTAARATGARLSAETEPDGATPLIGPDQTERDAPPRDWLPSEAAVAEALRLCPDADLDEHTARFVSRCRSKGYRYLSLDDAWLDWLLGDRRERRAAAAKPSTERPGRARSSRPSDHRLDRFDAWATAAAVPMSGTGNC